MAKTKARVLQDRVLQFRHPTRIFAQSRNPENLLGTLTTKQDSQIDIIGLFCPLQVANQDAAIKMKKRMVLTNKFSCSLAISTLYMEINALNIIFHQSCGLPVSYKSLLLVRHKSVAKNGELRS